MSLQMKIKFHPTSLVLIGITSITYIIIFFIILYKSASFYKELRSKSEFQEIESVSTLANLYMGAFIVQMIAIGLLFLLIFFQK